MVSMFNLEAEEALIKALPSAEWADQFESVIQAVQPNKGLCLHKHLSTVQQTFQEVQKPQNFLNLLTSRHQVVSKNRQAEVSC